MQKAGVVLMTNDFVSDGREGELLKRVLLLIKRGSHLFEKKKQFAAYFQACKSSFIDHHAPIDVTRVSNKDLKRKALQIL